MRGKASFNLTILPPATFSVSDFAVDILKAAQLQSPKNAVTCKNMPSALCQSSFMHTCLLQLMLNQEIFDGECKYSGTFEFCCRTAGRRFLESSFITWARSSSGTLQKSTPCCKSTQKGTTCDGTALCCFVEQRLYVKSCKLLDQFLLFRQQIPLLTLSLHLVQAI